MLLKVLSSLRYLLKQGLPIRGHHEENGNLVQSLQCRSEDIDNLKTWVSRKKYLSHEIINEQIEMMAHHVLRGLLEKIKVAEYFAVIRDETRDVSGKEQFAISIRWVDTDYVINEDLKVICNGKITHDFYISLYLFTHAMHKKHIFNN